MATKKLYSSVKDAQGVDDATRAAMNLLGSTAINDAHVEAVAAQLREIEVEIP